MTKKFEGIPLNRKIIMGVINFSSETFYEDSLVKTPEKTADKARKMVENGADIIDIGGMSTGPNAKTISMDKEKELLLPPLRAVRKEVDVPISIDTQRAGIAEATLEEGADIINDISGLKADRRMSEIVSEYDCSAVLMANKITGRPRRAEKKRKDIETIEDVKNALEKSLEICRKSGIDRKKIAVDPGIGFGREKESDLRIISNLYKLKKLNRPICVGISRKSFIGEVLDLNDPSERLIGSLGATAVAIRKGADIIRTHDPKETNQFVRIIEAIEKTEE